jgi:ankyrin repeat protein
MNNNFPSYIACDSGHWNCVELLLESGVSVDCRDKDGLTVLHKAVKAGMIMQVKTLIDHNADLLLVSPSNHSVLHMALPDCLGVFQQPTRISLNHDVTTAMIRLLVSSGADCNSVNALGETPLYRACSAGLEDVVEILLEAGSVADVVSTSRQPLMAACAAGSAHIRRSTAGGRSTCQRYCGTSGCGPRVSLNEAKAEVEACQEVQEENIEKSLTNAVVKT